MATRTAHGPLRVALFILSLFFAHLFIPSTGCAAVFTAAVQRPFPTLMPLDYSSCRAQAWLMALQKAVPTLPSYVDVRLRELDLDLPLGKLAICALLYPVDVVTPDISASVDITVYLAQGDPNAGKLAKILRNPENLALEMCVIKETQEKIKKLREIWPPTLEDARKRLKELDFYSNGLTGLWETLKLVNGKGEYDFARVSKIAALAGNSPVAQLFEALALLQADRPQRALAAASAGVEQAKQKLARPKAMAHIWSLVLARCLYARGIAQWRLNQPALAEADFEAGINSLGNLDHKYDVYAQLLLARGSLRGVLHNMEGMCADYVAACGFGKCQGLLEARAQGHCSKEAP